MNDASPAQLAAGALFLLYPFAIYLGLGSFDPRWLALLLIAIVGLRLAASRLKPPTAIPLAIAIAAATGYTLITGSQYGLLLYPVLVNGALLLLFAASLLRPPSVIETLARLREPDLPDAALAYTRKVTLVWAVFFALNGAIALATLYLDRTWWALYNGLIAYLLMGLLFGAEWLVRRRVRSRLDA